MNRKPYQKYSKEFKAEAVRLAEESDKPVTRIARELGIRQNQIYKWKKQLEIKGKAAFPGTGKISDADGELVRLRRELAVASEEIDLKPPQSQSLPIQAISGILTFDYAGNLISSRPQNLWEHRVFR